VIIRYECLKSFRLWRFLEYALEDPAYDGVQPVRTEIRVLGTEEQAPNVGVEKHSQKERVLVGLFPSPLEAGKHVCLDLRINIRTTENFVKATKPN
jgi:hypothetical protein